VAFSRLPRDIQRAFLSAAALRALLMH
jgi:hypothetical protein